MNENDISKTSKDSIPDAKYYLVRPKDSSMIYVMEDKPDYKKEPFYAGCAGCKSDMQDYLMENCLCELDLEEIDCNVDNYLYTLDLHPSENTVVCIFGESKAPSTLGPTKESKGTPIILNKRLLI